MGRVQLHQTDSHRHLEVVTHTVNELLKAMQSALRSFGGDKLRWGDGLQVVTDFFDELKSRSRGYASMEYKLTGYRRSDLVRLDIKINAEVSFPSALRIAHPNLPALHLPIQHALYASTLLIICVRFAAVTMPCVCHPFGICVAQQQDLQQKHSTGPIKQFGKSQWQFVGAAS